MTQVKYTYLTFSQLRVFTGYGLVLIVSSKLREKSDPQQGRRLSAVSFAKNPLWVQCSGTSQPAKAVMSERTIGLKQCTSLRCNQTIAIYWGTVGCIMGIHNNSRTPPKQMASSLHWRHGGNCPESSRWSMEAIWSQWKMWKLPSQEEVLRPDVVSCRWLSHRQKQSLREKGAFRVASSRLVTVRGFCVATVSTPRVTCERAPAWAVDQFSFGSSHFRFTSDIPICRVN